MLKAGPVPMHGSPDACQPSLPDGCDQTGKRDEEAHSGGIDQELRRQRVVYSRVEGKSKEDDREIAFLLAYPLSPDACHPWMTTSRNVVLSALAAGRFIDGL